MTSPLADVGVMGFALKGTSRVCRGRHGEVGIVEFGHYTCTAAVTGAAAGRVRAASLFHASLVTSYITDLCKVASLYRRGLNAL